MVLGALAALLEIEGDISVMAQARNGKEAVQAVLTHKPDVLITDIEMPLLTGLDAASRAQASASGNARNHSHHLRALRLSAPRHGGRSVGIPSQRYARRGTRRGRTPRASGIASHPSRSRHRSLGRDGSTHRSRTPSPASCGRRHAERRHRCRAKPVRGDGAQLPFRSHQQNGCEQPHRSFEDCPHQRVAGGQHFNR
jgi:hypothetical protein